jgi:hypothetical protein
MDFELPILVQYSVLLLVGGGFHAYENLACLVFYLIFTCTSLNRFHFEN